MVLSQSPALHICAFWDHFQRKTECPGYRRKRGVEFSSTVKFHATHVMVGEHSFSRKCWAAGSREWSQFYLGGGGKIDWSLERTQAVTAAESMEGWLCYCCSGEGKPLHKDYHCSQQSHLFPAARLLSRLSSFPSTAGPIFFQANGSYPNSESLLLVSLSPGEGGGKRPS